MAISIPLLDFYCVLFEKSCNAVNAMASALTHSMDAMVLFLPIKYKFLSPGIVEWLLLATSVIHEFVHQWACQIVNNPEIQTGLGLMDREGVEGLWSWMWKLIAVTQPCEQSCHLYIVNKQVTSIGIELCDDLSTWICCARAHQVLNSCGIEEAVLQSEWELQWASELSVRAHKSLPLFQITFCFNLTREASVCLKKELNTVLALQRTKLHQATCAAIKKCDPALMAGLRKYNNLCATLATMCQPKWGLPLPEPLPTELWPLHDAPSLMEDMWISHPMEQVPCWLSDI
ncbi:hypothetical protein J132_02142 [Termitomyces sp. J132]|nr:hypothetical protein J132_02142 [Termitomyces sp. J132]